ncbi:hypothetical protein ACIBJI_24620 [Nocardia sp. NPDC050408]|uniref:hypothetical protein n=1 Tax=Nocardia sp. NPDC050408 TaxID=3364319 RepID=UPI00378A7F0B
MASRRLLIILLVGIAAVVAAAFVLAVTGTDNTPNPPQPSDSPLEPTSPEQTTPAPAWASRPPTIDMFGNRLEVPDRDEGVALEQDPTTRPDPGRLDYLTTPPARIQWQRGWGGAALPFSGSDGPTTITAGVASGFANTPQGAGLAAYDALARALAAPDGVWQQVVTERFFGGGQAMVDRFARSRKSTPDASGYVVVPEGFRILPGYRPDFAVVQIAVKAIGGAAYSTWPMTWTDGDWRVRVPDDIETLWAPGVLTASLADFGSWKAMR